MNPSPSRRLQALAVLTALLCQILAPFAAAAPVTATVPQLLNYQGRVTVGGTNFNGTGYFKFSLVDGGTDQNKTATATCTVDVAGTVREFQVVTGGTGYVVPPQVTISGTGTGARAEAVLDGDYVREIIVTAGGSGYSQDTPTSVMIAPPPARLLSQTFWSNDGTAADGQEPQHAVARAVTKGLYAVLLGDADMEALTPQVFAHPDVRLRVWFSPSDRGEAYTLLTPDQRIAAVGYALMADDVKDGAITSAKLAANAVTLSQLSPELRQTITGLQAWQATQLPVITSAASATAAVDNVFTYQIIATGSPTAWNATGLPAGWSVNTAAGIVSGTPAATGTVTFNVTATNIAGVSAPRLVSVNVTGPVFVDFTTGADGNAGTQTAPVKTMAQGIAIARVSPVLRSVRVSGAAQSFTAPLKLAGGVDVRGGYDRSAGWTRTAPRTPLNYAPSSALNPIAVMAEFLDAPVLLDGFAITCPNASGAGVSHGGVGVKACYQHRVTISNNTISVGNGTSGGAAPNGTNGVPGVAGWNAVSWRGPHYPAGAAYLPASHAFDDFLGCGGIPEQRIIFIYSDYQLVDEVPVPAYAGWPVAANVPSPLSLVLGAAGGASGNSQTPPGNGTHGTPGASGSNGANYWSPSGLRLGSHLEMIGDGSPGSAGSGGGPGGDGGGGGSIVGSGSNTTLWGGGGGTGGKGGTGGTGGGGGKGAGGSFAVMVASSTVTVTGCTLTTGNGGAGGTGGWGGNGSLGGNGGAGFVTPAVGANNPGDGGWGGAGGNGGWGQGGVGGNGGSSIGIIAGTGASLTENGNTFTLGTAGSAGLGGLRGSSTTVRAPAGLSGLRFNVVTGVAP